MKYLVVKILIFTLFIWEHVYPYVALVAHNIYFSSALISVRGLFCIYTIKQVKQI